MENFRNRNVLITGASSGFGAETARRFAKEGARLFLGARRVDRLKSVADECLKLGASSAQFEVLDVASTESVRKFFNTFDPDFQKSLNLLVNNAGGAHGADWVESAVDSDWEAMMQSNVLGLLRMCRSSTLR